MDAQEQAKISAISKKPNVRFAATEDPPPDRVQPILDGLQKVLQTVLDDQNSPPEANVGEKAAGNGGPKKGKAKGTRAQSPALSDTSTSTVNPDSRYREPESIGRPNEVPVARSRDDNSFLDVRKDDRAISLTVPPLQIASLDSRYRNAISKHEDTDGTRVFPQVPQIFVYEDRRIDLFVDDVMCVDN